MRSTVVANMTVALCAGALSSIPLAVAGTTIATPRQASPKFDRPDSTQVVMHELGILLGTPAALNFEAGYWPDPVFGVRASGMYYGAGYQGVQGNLCFTVRRGPHSRVALAAVGGTHRETGDYWNYAGLALDWNVEPFYFELGPVGLSSNNGDFSGRRFAVVAQVGVMGGGGTLGPR